MGGYTRSGGLALAIALASPAHASHLFEGHDLAAGQVLYAEACASCHGADLEGQPNWQEAGEDGVFPAPPHSVEGHTWHHDTDMLFDYIKLGGTAALDRRGLKDFASGMPAFADTLSDAQIYDVLAYIRSTWGPRQQAFQAERTPH